MSAFAQRPDAASSAGARKQRCGAARARHLFNHQTHHRGQVHDQLSQTTVAPPTFDLIFYQREAGEPP